MKTALLYLLTFFTVTIAFGQIDEKKLVKKWKVTEVISLAMDFGNKDAKVTEQQFKQALLQSVFEFKADYSFKGNAMLMDIPQALWKLDVDRIYVYDKEISKKGLFLEMKIKEMGDNFIIAQIVDDGLILMTFRMQ